MALQKQPVSINFAQGLETKVDDKQVPAGKFLALSNSVFDKQGRLTKRNGFPLITTLPDTLQTTLTTFSSNLLATGSNLFAYSQDTDQWLDKGLIQPIDLSVQALVRVSTSQTAPDTAVTSLGLTALVYVDGSQGYYQVSDSVTDQQIVNRTALPATATNPRVFLLGRYFIITFIATVAGTPHLRYIAVPIANPFAPLPAVDISSNVLALTTGYDAFVANNSLYFGWSGATATVELAYLSSTLIVSPAVSIAAHTADLLSMTADITGPTAIVWVSFWDTTSDDGFVAAFSQNLAPVLAPTQIITNVEIAEITSVAQNGLLTVLYENVNTYGYAPFNRTDFISKVTVTQAGVVSLTTVILRSVGLASKAFIDTDNDKIYVLATYGETNQPTYFLIDSTGAIYMRLAYANGGGYQSSQVLPTASFVDGFYYTPYLITDFLAPVNKGTALPAGTPTNGIYTQKGVNLAKFAINTDGQFSSEIANVLNLTGGQVWQYDGVKPVEQGFHVWPENMDIATAGAGGSITAGTYYYVFTYEWTDNQGMLHRSAPSIPITVTTVGATSANTIHVPMLRLTYKIQPNPVRIVGYRYSVSQPVYYQFTSLTNPYINDPSQDIVTITDTSSDLQILGNVLLYTTGGVLENIAPPAAIHSALYKNRYFIIDAEDRNLIWYSKQVIQSTPVEMSDLLTVYVAPSTGSQGSTGPLTALSAMDDKLIMFKKAALYYLTGIGPDNTGANNDFSDPIYITGSVGTANPSSIVLTPNGIMFQSDKGIWLLGRDLSTSYIGAPVEKYNSYIVQSAQVIPGTNQVRFILNNNITLMYDFYQQQWGTFSNIMAISSTLYQGKDTYLNIYGQVLQEAIGTYVDNSTPVLMSFTTSWINLAGLQGYERFYEMLMVGTYFTPFILNVQLAYDYNPSSTQATRVTPDNYTPAWGGEAQWGSDGPWGGPGNIFEARVFPERQKCESFQITINEVYDPSFGLAAGQGLTLSGLNLVVGAKKGWRTQKASQSFG